MDDSNLHAVLIDNATLQNHHDDGAVERDTAQYGKIQGRAMLGDAEEPRSCVSWAKSTWRLAEISALLTASNFPDFRGISEIYNCYDSRYYTLY